MHRLRWCAYAILQTDRYHRVVGVRRLYRHRDRHCHRAGHRHRDRSGVWELNALVCIYIPVKANSARVVRYTCRLPW
jgi:hypothetical protein